MEITPPFGKKAAESPIGREFAMARRLRGFFEKLDFSAVLAFNLGKQMELNPIPVKARRRR